VLSPEFNANSITARCSTAICFMHAHSFVYQTGMHELQCKPEEVEGGVKDPFVFGNHRVPRFVLNMDQTPVYFSMNSKRTLELIEKKTIHIRTSINDTKRATVAVIISGNGTVLPSVVVYGEGEKGGSLHGPLSPPKRNGEAGQTPTRLKRSTKSEQRRKEPW